VKSDHRNNVQTVVVIKDSETFIRRVNSGVMFWREGCFPAGFKRSLASVSWAKI